ncbi:MAG: hypothetical protein AB1637_02060 [Elusimicrobiota bacterium]
MSGIYFAFTKEERLPNMQKTAQVLVKSRNMILYEALSFSAKSYGFLGENIDIEEIKKIMQVCEEYRLKADYCNSEKVPVLNPVLEIKKAYFSDSLISFESGNSEIKYDLKDLKIMAYAPICEESIKVIKEKQGPQAAEKAIRLGIMMATGLPIGLGKNKEISREIKKRETYLYLDLIFSDNVRIRINSENFDFSCLKEEKGYSSQINFKNFCLKIAQKAEKTWKNTAIFDLLEGALSPTLKYETLSDLEKEEKRLLLAQLKNF